MAVPLKYNFRSLFRRRVSTLMTVLSIALVVAIFMGVMALATGLERALVESGGPLNILVRRQGSDSEMSSFVSREALQTLKYLPGVATLEAEPVVSPEIVVVINLLKRGEEQGANVTIRGLSEIGLNMRHQVQVVEGLMFQPGLREVIVSQSIRERFQSTEIGDSMRFGKGDWKVVGIFDGGRTAFDSEIWTDYNQVASDYNRQSSSSILLRANDEASVQRIIDRVENDRRYNLIAQPEISYYEEQTKTAAPIKAMGIFIAVVMGIGACFAAMNTMYSAVAFRTKEIATLRILGFKKGSILLSFLTEAMLLALATVSGAAAFCQASIRAFIFAVATHRFSTSTASRARRSKVAGE